jgi:hypothetical protein
LVITSVPAKLAGFVVILAAVFGLAYLTGTQSAALLAPVEQHDNDLGGFSATAEGYTLSVVEPETEPGEDRFVEFTITGPDGRPVGELNEVNGAHMHLIAFRGDLTGYQHITPEAGEGTSWWAVLNLSPGPWHVIVELAPRALGREIDLAVDFTVRGDYRPEPSPAPADEVNLDGLTVRRGGTLTTRPESRSTFTVTDGGEPVTDLQPVHGSLGHAVIIRPADLGYRHLHTVPTTSSGPVLTFEGGVPEPGVYRVFVEFYRAEKLHVPAYAVEVSR